MENYEKLVERIAKSSGVDKEEIGRRVEAKKAKLSGLISREGAAQIVAAELGISFDNEILKISELSPGMKRANVTGQVTRVFPVREFNKNGREGKVGNLLLGDDTSNIRVVLWDVNHIALIEKGEIAEGKVVQISNASVRNGELHLSTFSDIKSSGEKIDNVKKERSFSLGKLKDASAGQGVKTRAVIVQIFEPRYFDSKEGEKRAALSFVIDDGTENLRGVLFGQNINKLGFTNEEVFSLEKFNEKKAEILGEEKVFSGNYKMNTFFNKIEISVEGVEDIDPDELIKELENKLR